MLTNRNGHVNGQTVRRRIKPRKPEPYDNSVDGFDEPTEVVGTRRGRPVVRYKTGPLPTKEEFKEKVIEQSVAMGKLDGELDEVGVLYRERKANRDHDAKTELDLGKKWDEDDGHYKRFTGHSFWQAVHPPLKGAGTKRTPPEDKHTVPVPRWVSRITPSWPERMILALLAYWFQHSRHNGILRAKFRRNGHLWVAKTDKMMAAECMLTPRLVKKCRARLVEAGVIVVEHHRVPVRRQTGTVMLRMCWYRIDWDKLEQAYLEGGGTYERLRDSAVEGAVRKWMERTSGLGQDDGGDDEEDDDEDD